jgi:predicted PurR-regulated permease PerM
MNTNENSPASYPSDMGGPLGWQRLLGKLAIWGLFVAVLYLARDFFFTAFMTFIFCYLTLAVVGWGMRRLSPDRERPGLRRLLVVAVFVLVPLALLIIGLFVGPRLVEQGQRMAGWLSQVSPETEVARLLEGYVGPSEFKRQYGGPTDPRYQKGLKEFRQTGEGHVEAYNEFPHLEAWVEAGFAKQFLEAEAGQLRHQLTREGTSSKAFADWFLKDKVPELQAQARKQVPEKGRPSTAVNPLVRAAATATPQQLLDQAHADPTVLAGLEQEWIQDTVALNATAATKSPAYREQFHAYYDQQRATAPSAIPYTYDQYVELQKVRPQGRRAFSEAVDKMIPTAPKDNEARLRADFEAAKEHELFRQWWGTSPTGNFLRHQIQTRVSSGDSGTMDRIISSLLNIPVDLSTALLLSLFICIDFPNLRRAVRGLRDTPLRPVYDELAPAISMLGRLIGMSMHAQGMIALCNAVMIFVSLTLIGVEHTVLLAAATFVLCLVPTLGTVMAWGLIVAVALIQPGGGLILAAEASAAVLVVILMETFVFSPRILGRMMELHPVLLIALLPVAQYFFGVWGLILATPVAVYVVHVLIFRRGLPGSHESRGETPAGTRSSPMAPDATVASESRVQAEENPVTTPAG